MNIRWSYFLALLVCFIPAMVMGWIHRRVLKSSSFRLFNWTVFVAALPFLIWEGWAIHRDYWQYTETHIIGTKWFGIPMEEYLFLALVPQASLLIWVVIKRYDTWDQLRRDLKLHLIRARKMMK